MAHVGAKPVESKSFDSPDERRPFEGKGFVDIVTVGGHTVGRGEFEPGWKWSNNLKPIAGTDSCEVSHLGYCMQGQMRIYMDDGSQYDINAGDTAAIPPGHDAEVVGDEECIVIHFGVMREYAKR
jgi:hypothetical protein